MEIVNPLYVTELFFRIAHYLNETALVHVGKTCRELRSLATKYYSTRARALMRSLWPDERLGALANLRFKKLDSAQLELLTGVQFLTLARSLTWPNFEKIKFVTAKLSEECLVRAARLTGVGPHTTELEKRGCRYWELYARNEARCPSYYRGSHAEYIRERLEHVDELEWPHFDDSCAGCALAIYERVGPLRCRSDVYEMTLCVIRSGSEAELLRLIQLVGDRCPIDIPHEELSYRDVRQRVQFIHKHKPHVIRCRQDEEYCCLDLYP